MFGAPRRGAGQVAAIVNNGVEHLAIVRGDVLHVAHIFVAAFNFEGTYPGIDQRGQVGGLIVVFH